MVAQSSKKIRRLFLPALVLGSAFWLARPDRAVAFMLTGELLDLTQRDFRIFPNFTDPLVNLNQVADPNFPGASGAELAIWKAVSEWGSELRADGSGDFHQPFGLGSGGANFDAHYLGLAQDVGGLDDNTISELDASNSGTLAFTETPTGDGWRIRFVREPWNWHASPSGTISLGFFEKDLQGVATHEYGHALGLGHSVDVAATMFGTSLNSDLIRRSIEADDIAGLHSIYGVRSASKPHVETYELAGGTITIRGERFHPTDNEVWFPRAAPVSVAAPIIVAATSSANGTRIDVALPAGVGTGDLVVKRDGAGHDSLSNAFPFDPAAAPCPVPRIFGTSKVASTGAVPDIYTAGTPKQSIDNFAIACESGIPNAFGWLVFGGTEAATPFFGGTLWAARPLRRHTAFSFDFGGQLFVPLPIEDEMVGQQRFYQIWFRDPGDPFGVGLSNGIEVTFCL